METEESNREREESDLPNCEPLDKPETGQGGAGDRDPINRCENTEQLENQPNPPLEMDTCADVGKIDTNGGKDSAASGLISAIPSVISAEESERLARDGNPDFIYDKVYLPGTTRECPSFKCLKCPTSVDRMDRLDSHYLSHGANKKYKCKFCDFSVDLMHVILRHEESHRAQKQKKQALLEGEKVSATVASLPADPSPAGRRFSNAGRSESGNETSPVVPKTPEMVTDHDEMEDEESIEIDIDSDEEFDVGIESGEEMELGNEDEQEVKSSVEQELNEEAANAKRRPKSPTYSSSIGSPDSRVPQGLEHPDSKGPNVGGKNWWLCQFCPATFKYQSFKKRHEILHEGKRGYSCNYCTFSTSTPFSLTEHIRLHEPQNANRASSKRMRSSSPAHSLASSEGGSTSTSRSKGSQRSQRSNSKSNRTPTDEEMARFREGNPAFIYRQHFRQAGSKMIEVQMFRCFKCPNSYTMLRDLNNHLLRHGAKDGAYSCRVCDYSHNVKKTFQNHLDGHRAQGNISSHLLTFPGVESTAKGGFDIGNANEVAIIGNENDFEIEYDGVESNSPQQPESDPLMDIPNDSPLPSPEPVQKPETRIDILPQRHTSKPFDIYNINPDFVDLKNKARSDTYLLNSMKVSNFMCFEEINFNLNSDAVTFSGGEGKSTSIIAILLCLGYDLLIENNTPSVICGWEISDLIRRGRDVAVIEISLCLKSYASLSAKYGNELKIRRTLRRGVQLSASTFQLTSARGTMDLGGSPNSMNSITVQQLRGILKELSILPLYSRLLLLDKQNLKVVMNERESWYDYFMDTVTGKGKLLRTNLEKLTPIFERLEGDLNWRKAELRFLKEQLMTDYPIEEDPAFLHWRNDDVKRRRKVERDIEELEQKYAAMEKLTSSYTDQLASVPSIVLKEMRTIFIEFLASQNCIGDILIDDKEKSLRIWLREKGSSEDEIPINPLEAEDSWGKTAQGKRQLGIFGLYLGFWKVNDICPFFAVDAYSSAELEFKFPAKGLSVLMRLVRSKSGQQFLMSYPESS